MRQVLLGIVVLSGLSATLVSGHFARQDWHALNFYYARYEQAIEGKADVRAITIADAQQNAFRINCFADGVGVLLGGILAAIGVHGLCLLPARGRAK